LIVVGAMLVTTFLLRRRQHARLSV
jgi:hypothetical protein